MASSQSSSKPKLASIFIEDIGNIEIRESKRTKHLKLAVSARSGVYVVKPRGVSGRTVRHFVSVNEAWLKKRIAKMPDKLNLKQNQQFSRTKTLKVVSDSDISAVSVRETPGELVLSLPSGAEFYDEEVQEVLMKHAVKIWRHEAKIYLPKRLEILSNKTGLEYKDVRVKHMHTRWGSCSSSNNINLNIQLMRLEPELIDHVILHELAHTKEHNHSKAFWVLFESLETDARLTSKLLKSQQLF